VIFKTIIIVYYGRSFKGVTFVKKEDLDKEKLEKTDNLVLDEVKFKTVATEYDKESDEYTTYLDLLPYSIIGVYSYETVKDILISRGFRLVTDDRVLIEYLKAREDKSILGQIRTILAEFGAFM
jgi:hypothetical protein